MPNSAKRQSLAAVLPPASASGARTTDFVDASAAARFMATLNFGASSAAGTFLFQRATTAAGASAENASATVAFGGTSTTGDDTVFKLPFDAGQYATTAKPFVAIKINAGGTYLSAATIEALDERFSPTDEGDDVTYPDLPAVA